MNYYLIFNQLIIFNSHEKRRYREAAEALAVSTKMKSMAQVFLVI